MSIAISICFTHFLRSVSKPRMHCVKNAVNITRSGNLLTREIDHTKIDNLAASLNSDTMINNGDVNEVV